MKNKQIALCAMLCALAIVFGYIESLIPVPIPIPGIKLGLSNLVLLYALFAADRKTAWLIMPIKVIATCFLFSGTFALMYSLVGGIFSLFGMSLLCRRSSVVFTSIAGGILHNVGQLCVAALLLTDFKVGWFLPWLVLSGLVVGAIIGIVGKVLLERLPKNLFQSK